MGYDSNDIWSNMETPLEQYKALAKVIGIKDLYFKREDLHQYGSHKGRSIPAMIAHYVKHGDTHFAVSSSGNAGLAAAMFVAEHNLNIKNSPIEIDIFVGQNASPHKVARIRKYENDHIKVMIKERPLQALTAATNEGARSLRQSTDDEALKSYESLTKELVDSKKAGSVFIGTSSGTTAQALTKGGFQVHIVQTPSCHPFADAFETYDGPNEDSVADAIVDKVAHRKDKLIPLIKKSGGRGWTVTNDEIEHAQDLVLKHTDLDISTNSALSVAGLIKAVELGYDITMPVVCMICGE